MSSDLYLTEKQEKQIMKAIKNAENRTSGEIRVHIEARCNKNDPLVRASRVFHELGMDQTELQNGVLIYIAAEDHKVAVYAGQGIHDQVEDGFWDDVLKIIVEHFKNDEFEEGIDIAVEKVGKKLTEMYPGQKGDSNELKDDISYHDNR